MNHMSRDAGQHCLAPTSTSTCYVLHLFCDEMYFFFFSSRRRHTRFDCDWSSDVCSSDLSTAFPVPPAVLALIVTGCASAPDGTTNTCGPINIVPPAEPIVCFRDAEGSLLHCSRPPGVACVEKAAVIPVGGDRSDRQLPERSPTAKTTKTETTRAWRTIRRPSRQLRWRGATGRVASKASNFATSAFAPSRWNVEIGRASCR